MDIIKKFIPLDIYLTLSKVKYGHSSFDGVALLSTFLYTFTFVHIFIGIVFYFLSPDVDFTYTEEDGYIGYFTAIFLLAASLRCLYKASITNRKIPMLFLYAAAFVFFLGFGEEISWGQRII